MAELQINGAGFCPLCNRIAGDGLLAHLKTNHRRWELRQWIATNATAPGELEDERFAYKAQATTLQGAQTQRDEAERGRLDALQQLGETRRELDAALAITRSLQQALDTAQTEVGKLRAAMREDDRILDQQADRLHAAESRADQLQHKLEVLAENAYNLANPTPGAHLVQCAACGLWVADLAAHLDGQCEETNPPQGRPLPSVDNTPAGEEMAPITAVQIPSPAFDLLNGLAWYIRNASNPDGEKGWGAGLLEYGPAHKLLEALDRYIHATNHGEDEADKLHAVYMTDPNYYDDDPAPLGDALYPDLNDTEGVPF